MSKPPQDLISKRFGHTFEDDVEVAKLVVHAEIAQAIREARRKAGLSQQELASSMGTTQSVISRLEDPDYDGHSISSLVRVATALELRLRTPELIPQGRPASLRLGASHLPSVDDPKKMAGIIANGQVPTFFRNTVTSPKPGYIDLFTGRDWQRTVPTRLTPDEEMPDAA